MGGFRRLDQQRHWVHGVVPIGGSVFLLCAVAPEFEVAGSA